MNPIFQAQNLGQSIWLDYIQRNLVTSGELKKLVQGGISGLTSNPAIFQKAIAGSTDYDEALERLVDEGKTVNEIYEALALDDIQRAADILRPVYEQTGGADGYVSLEVNPNLAHDTNGTIAEARRLFAALGRPNVMIKVPATPAGIPTIETLIGEGINVNVTLIFSLTHYEVVAEAYLAGLEKYAAAGGDVSQVASTEIPRFPSTPLRASARNDQWCCARNAGRDFARNDGWIGGRAGRGPGCYHPATAGRRRGQVRPVFRVTDGDYR